MNVWVILQQMLTLAVMMTIGFYLHKKEWIDEDTYGKLSRMVVNIFNPLLIIDGVINKSFTRQSGNIGENLVFMLLYFVVLLMLGGMLAPFFARRREERNIYQLMTVFSNVGFMGIPIITSIYGKESMIYITFYILGYNVLLYTLGVWLFQSERKGISLRGLLKNMLNPGVVASILGILLFLWNPPVPQFAKSLCSYMGTATVPLSMILIGFSLADTNWRALFGNVRMLLFVAVKMLAIPIGAALCLKYFAFSSVIEGIFVLQLAMPVGSILALMAVENGRDGEICTNGIVLSTLASVVTVPIVCIFL